MAGVPPRLNHVIRARMSAQMLEALDTSALRIGLSRSSFLRLLVATHLAEETLWPPQRISDAD